eukprot:7466414-Lingulodinium_polyedra.AAC.1
MERICSCAGVFPVVVIHDGMVLRRPVFSYVVQQAFSDTTSAFGLPNLRLAQKPWGQDLAAVARALAS